MYNFSMNIHVNYSHTLANSLCCYVHVHLHAYTHVNPYISVYIVCVYVLPRATLPLYYSTTFLHICLWPLTLAYWPGVVWKPGTFELSILSLPLAQSFLEGQSPCLPLGIPSGRLAQVHCSSGITGAKIIKVIKYSHLVLYSNPYFHLLQVM